jgi:pyruvate,water dikinase
MDIIPFNSEAATLERAGGKGANLSRLTRAGFNVPRGFILSTGAYRSFVAENGLQALILAALEQPTANDPDALEQLSDTLRATFSAGKLPLEIEQALHSMYTDLQGRPIAVRSSATAEDLPELSFAGQQDTYLNILGEEQLQRAVIDCWSSLWTARAIGYRQRNGIRQDEVALAVVVQEMIESVVSGVLFTANPLSGQLNEAVIDATFGLGEALVSGQVEPDHFVVDSHSGALKSLRLGEKRLVIQARPGGGVETLEEEATALRTLKDAELSQLAAAGQAIQQEFGSPQDIEWAMASGRLYILQARAITSLFPIPQVSYDPLLVWFSFGTVQGLVGPITPLGQATILNVAAHAGELFGLEISPDQVSVFELAGQRIWIKISAVIRNPLGSRVLNELLGFVEPSVGQIIKSLTGEPELGTGSGRLKFSTLRRIAGFALPILARFVRTLLSPVKARADFDERIDAALAAAQLDPADDRFGRLAAVLSFLRARIATAFRFLLPQFLPVYGPGMASLNLLRQLSGDANLAIEVTRGLPRNVTTEMDLELWATAQAIHADAGAKEIFRAGEAAQLAQRYLDGTLPAAAQTAIAGFMQKYGMRGVGEIDFGQPRWRDEPAPVMHSLQSYLSADAQQSPGAMFVRGEQAALLAIEKIAAHAHTGPAGWLKEKLIRAAALRVRVLLGARESPKFFIIRIMGIARQALLQAGQEFVAAGTLTKPDDLVFLNLSELDELAQNSTRDWKTLVAARRAVFERETRRRQVPRVLVSDGRAFYEGIGAETDTGSLISGSPVSPGLAEGRVHVVLDPRGTQLSPGEILVCPGTDPAWTPLFMVAGGLITEVGGMMTHGSVVAREYGIPAVVGVHQATTRLKDGQLIRLDGTTGKIIILEE